VMLGSVKGANTQLRRNIDYAERCTTAHA
jgi:hypothetical protein